MKRLLLILLITASFVSCEKSEGDKIINDNLLLKDPINGVSEYLLTKVVRGSQSGSYTVENNYDENGVLVLSDLKVFPENLNSLEMPYIISDGKKYFCDDKRRVIREESENGITYFKYDDKNRLLQRIVGGNASIPGDTTDYTYSGILEGNTMSYSTSRKYYEKSGDLKYRLLGTQNYTYYYSINRDLKSWITYPYNYGSIMKHPLIKTNYYRSYAGRLVETPFYNTFDENGLITVIESPNNTNPYKENYFYKKK